MATAQGRRVGRPVLAEPDDVAWAVHVGEQPETIAEIIKKNRIARTSLHRHTPPGPLRA